MTTTKICSRCRLDLPIASFSKSRGGLTSACKACISVANKAAYAANRAKLLERNKRWHENNREKVKAGRRKRAKQHAEAQRAYRAANPDKAIDTRRKWQRANPDKCAELNRRHRKKYPEKGAAQRRVYEARKQKAVPSWFEKTKVAKVYAKARELSRWWGLDLEVDHVVPLHSDIVCGLHCFANLQILEAGLNASKGNRDWPDRP